MRKEVKVTKTMAIALAKHLLGKVQFVVKDYRGFVFTAGQVTLEIQDESSGYLRDIHEYFDNFSNNGKPYDLPCYKVYWTLPGSECVPATYYKMNDEYEPILYVYIKDDEE